MLGSKRVAVAAAPKRPSVTSRRDPRFEAHHFFGAQLTKELMGVIGGVEALKVLGITTAARWPQRVQA